MAVWLALSGHRDAFFILVIISFISDLIDGPIARWSGEDSQFGAKLDTIADLCTMVAAIIGLYIFERETLLPELPWLYLFVASYSAAAITCLAKFGKLPAYHLYLSKTAAFCAGAFFARLYLVDYSRQFFLATICLGLLANLESSLVSIRLKRFRTDIGSLFFSSTKQHNDDGL